LRGSAWANDPARSGLNIEQRLVGNQMIKRPGRMDDLADVALFLCSDRASFMTRQTILVDGGYTKNRLRLQDQVAPLSRDQTAPNVIETKPRQG
jgi:NAD(P)-dependent dehydrogenase (short-subunit alcohol dehydrogenase family)